MSESALPIRLEHTPQGVAVITLQRADRLNALSSEVAIRLREAVATIDDDHEIRVAVICGEGRAFCAGADITELETFAGSREFTDFVTHLTEAFQTIVRSPKPFVAAVHGAALGGGFELALSCDLRVAEEGTRLGVPEVKLGLLPGATGCVRLARELSPAVAKQLLLTGNPLVAEDALRVGLVNAVVPAGTARAAALDLAGELVSLPPLALAAAKRLVDDSIDAPIEDAIALERSTVARLFDTADRVEGLAAFLEKRAPVFRGS